MGQIPKHLTSYKVYKDSLNMADDYLNPQALRPQATTGPFAVSPNPGLQGMYNVRDRARYEDLARLQDILMKLKTDTAQEEYTQGMPVRQAERTAKIADLPMKSRDLAATTGMNEDKRTLSGAMLPGQIDIGKGQQDLDKGQQQIARVIQVIAQTPPGPDYAARLGQVIQGAGYNQQNMPPALRQILSVSNPKEAQQRAQAFIQQQSATNPAYRQAMDVVGAQGQTARDVAEINRKSAKEAALARAAAKNKSAMQLLKESPNPLTAVTRAGMIYADFESDAQTKEYARRVIMQNWEAYVAQVQKGAMAPIPGFPQVKPLRNPYEGRPGPSAAGRIGGESQAYPAGTSDLPQGVTRED